MKKLLSVLIALFTMLPISAAEEPLCFTANTDGSSVTLNGNLSATFSISYDATNWIDYTCGSVINLNKSEKVYFASGETPNKTISAARSYYTFEMTGSIASSGNIMSLIQRDCNKDTIPNFAFNKLFQNCVSLTSAPKLPCQNLGDQCYNSMFSGCSNLTTAPELPATELRSSCYYGMFSGCTNLTSAPVLEATVIKANCYQNMFDGCTNLTSVQANLPAETMANYCYAGMFRNCSKLANTPTISATTLAPNCFQSMFEGCSAITSTPELPCTTLATNCYNKMFKGCTGITTAPNLPASTLVNGCYANMFYGCTKLNSIKVAFHDWTTGATTGWMTDVKTIGIIQVPAILTLTYGANNIPTNWSVTSPQYLCVSAKTANAKVQLTKTGSPTKLNGLEYSTNGFDWNTYTPGTTGYINMTNIGDYVYFKATNTNTTFSTGESNYYKFQMSGTTAVTGNVMSLLDKDCNQKVVPDYAFEGLFLGCTYMTSAPEFPATTVGNNAYKDAFMNCSSLTTAPELNATKLGEYCYARMFYNCTGLKNVQEELPADTVNYRSYVLMYRGCSSLTKAPKIAATTMNIASCYQMFSYCTSLTDVPDLNAPNLANYCYWSMFNGCSSLVNAPKLPATTLAIGCYSNMFKDCTKLKNAPQLPAETLVDNCYEYMFNGCSSLNSISVSFTSWLDGATAYWVNYLPETGKFDCPDELDQTIYDANHIPSGWSVAKALCFKAVNAGAEITLNKVGTPTEVEMRYSTNGNEWMAYEYGTPITLANEGDCVYFSAASLVSGFSISSDNYYQFTISDKTAASGNIMSLMDPSCAKNSLSGTSYCFYKLFYDCTDLTKAPTLSATTLAKYCYSHMFQNCTSLTEAPLLSATRMQTYCYSNMFSGCTNLKSIPALLSNNLSYGCYAYMFNACTSLDTVPELPAATVPTRAYSYMFMGCSGIKGVADLNATNAAGYAYINMFNNCTSLKKAPEIALTTISGDCVCQGMFNGCTNMTSAPTILRPTALSNKCYYLMFYKCANITAAPKLPATTLATYCYSSMFKGCTKLNKSPLLSAQTLVEGCYNNMFENCTKLSSIQVECSDWVTNATTDWVKNCTASGYIYCPTSLGSDKSNDQIPANYSIRSYPQKVTLNAKGYSTYSASTDVEIVDGGGAYACTLRGTDIICDSLTNIMAGTGALLYGKPGATITFHLIDNNGMPIEPKANELNATTNADNMLNAVENTGYTYVLSGDQFKRYTGATFAANKAYFWFDSDPLASYPGATLRFIFDDREDEYEENETELQEITKAESVVENCFNMSGQKIANNSKGMQIKNGKIIFVK